jgi:hypothetical protein
MLESQWDPIDAHDLPDPTSAGLLPQYFALRLLRQYLALARLWHEVGGGAPAPAAPVALAPSRHPLCRPLTKESRRPRPRPTRSRRRTRTSSESYTIGGCPTYNAGQCTQIYLESSNTPALPPPYSGHCELLACGGRPARDRALAVCGWRPPPSARLPAFSYNWPV